MLNTNNSPETKQCPYCGGQIMAAAKKCKYCGEWLDGQNQSRISRNENVATTSSHSTQVKSDVTITHSNTKKIIPYVVGVIILIAIITVIVISNQKSDYEKYMEEYEEALENQNNSQYFYDNNNHVEEWAVEEAQPEVRDNYYYDDSRTEAYDYNSDANSWN